MVEQAVPLFDIRIAIWSELRGRETATKRTQSKPNEANEKPRFQRRNAENSFLDAMLRLTKRTHRDGDRERPDRWPNLLRLGDVIWLTHSCSP